MYSRSCMHIKEGIEIRVHVHHVLPVLARWRLGIQVVQSLSVADLLMICYCPLVKCAYK